VLAIFSDDFNSKEHSIYKEVAANGAVNEKFQFFHLNDKECAGSHGAEGPHSLVLFRQFDTSPLVYSGNWEVTPIVDWMLASSVPTVIEFSEDYIEPIFGQKSQAIFLFRSADDASSDFSKVFEEAAKSLKGQILFVVSGVSDGI
jgi:protein disulfide-isomerase A1